MLQGLRNTDMSFSRDARQHTRQDAERGRLAGAVDSQEAKALALADPQRHVPHRMDERASEALAVVLSQLGEDDLVSLPLPSP